MLEKLMKLKKDRKMGDAEQKAKSTVLEDLLGQAQASMADGLKKVTVAAKDDAGLEEGLEKAEEILEAKPEGLAEMAGMEEDEYEDGEMSEEYEEAENVEAIDEDLASLSPEEIDLKIQELLKLKEKLS